MDKRKLYTKTAMWARMVEILYVDRMCLRSVLVRVGSLGNPAQEEAAQALITKRIERMWLAETGKPRHGDRCLVLLYP